MATSGSVKTSDYGGRYYQLDWTATQSVANNTSTISWTLKAVGGSASWYAERTLKVVIGGTTVYSKTNSVNRYTGTVTSGTTTITHNSDGKKSFSISIQAAVYYSTVNCTGSETFELTPIARVSTLSVAAGSLGSSQTLQITRQNTTFKHKLKYTCGNASGYILGSDTSFSTADGVTFTAPLELAKQNTTGTSVSIKFTLYTYTSGGDSVGSKSYTKLFTMTSDANPTCSISLSDAGTLPNSTTTFYSKFGGYVKGHSKFNITVTPTPKYDTKVDTYKVSANGTEYTANKVTTTSKTFTTDVLKNSGSQKVKATVTDKRGLNGSAESASVTVLPYEAPVITKLTVHRCKSATDGTEYSGGAHVKVTYAGTISSLNQRNTKTWQLKFKAYNASSWSTVTLSPSTPTLANDVYTYSDNSYIFSADTGSSFDIQVVATDAITSTTRSTSVSSAYTMMHFSANGKGLGLGKVAEFDGLDVNFVSRFKGNVNVGSKTGYLDGKDGVHINKKGYIHLQRNDTANPPYIAFIHGTSTALDCYIRYNQTSKNMEFLKAAGYVFDKPLDAYSFRAEKGLTLMTSDTTGKTQMNFATYWVDKDTHNVVTRNNDGLTSVFGWSGAGKDANGNDTTYASKTYIAGQTIKLRNSNGADITSDERLKKDFSSLDKWSAFYYSLEPCAFKMKTGNSGRYHIGFKAQQVEKALTDNGLTTKDFGGFVKSNYTVDEDNPKETQIYQEAGINPGDDEYGLIYTEFIALNTYMIQKLQKEKAELSEKVNDLEDRLSKLEAVLNTKTE